jgi:hypothetical protein
MKTYAFIVTVLLLLSGGAIYYLIDHNKAEQANRYGDNLRLQGVIESVRQEATARITQLQARGDTLAKKVVRDSLASSDTIRTLSVRISAQSRTIVALRVIAQPKIDENPEIGELVNAQDVQIGYLDSLINAQELACRNQVTDLNHIVRLQGQEIAEALSLAEAEKQRGDEQEQAVKREKRGKKFWQWVAGIAAGVAVVVSLK